MKRLVLLSLFAVSSPLLAGESSLETLKTNLLQCLKPLESEASNSDKTLTVKFHCDKFMIHSVGKDGHIDTTPREEEAPNVDGFFMTISIIDGNDQLQAVVPQTLREPYWQTYINAYETPGKKLRVLLRLEYGSIVKMELREIIIQQVAEFAAKFKSE